MELSERIIRIREENGLTQEQMAERLFVTRQAISKNERGLSCPSLDVLRLLCKEFNVNMDDLLGIGEKGEEYKAIGYRHHGFALLYGLLLLSCLAYSSPSTSFPPRLTPKSGKSPSMTSSWASSP